MFDEDPKLKLAKDVWDQMNSTSKEEIKRLIKAGSKEYYAGYFDGLSQIHNAFNVSTEKAQESCSRLIVLAFIILNNEDLNILENRKFIN